jgi:hopene-associated glycosyltransferase HpnB
MALSVPAVLGCLSVLVWVGLLFCRGGFWRADQKLENVGVKPADWPSVTAIVPARNEADVIARAVTSLLDQDYQGAFSVLVVDDNSEDETVRVVKAVGRAEGFDLSVLSGKPLAPGWTGKLWAMAQGVEVAGPTDFFLMTDADIEHEPGNLRRLIAKAEVESIDLVSLMVRLIKRTAWERLLIPAFVFFFQKLYPFPWVNDRARATAAAAGGCMLVRRSALEAAGGLTAIRGNIIDDCALAGLIKRRGGIWLGLGDKTQSLRGYDTLGGIWRMVARSAYAQLGFSSPMLGVAVFGMVVLYVVPPVAVTVGLLTGDGLAIVAGAIGWAFMAWAYRPTLVLYGEGGMRAFLLPAAAILYMLMTTASAWQHWLGRGGAWKGRHYSEGAAPPG